MSVQYKVVSLSSVLNPLNILQSFLDAVGDTVTKVSSLPSHPFRVVSKGSLKLPVYGPPLRLDFFRVTFPVLSGDRVIQQPMTVIAILCNRGHRGHPTPLPAELTSPRHVNAIFRPPTGGSFKAVMKQGSFQPATKTAIPANISWPAWINLTLDQMILDVRSPSKETLIIRNLFPIFSDMHYLALSSDPYQNNSITHGVSSALRLAVSGYRCYQNSENGGASMPEVHHIHVLLNDAAHTPPVYGLPKVSVPLSDTGLNVRLFSIEHPGARVVQFECSGNNGVFSDDYLEKLTGFLQDFLNQQSIRQQEPIVFNADYLMRDKKLYVTFFARKPDPDSDGKPFRISTSTLTGVMDVSDFNRAWGREWLSLMEKIKPEHFEFSTQNQKKRETPLNRIRASL